MTPQQLDALAEQWWAVEKPRRRWVAVPVLMGILLAMTMLLGAETGAKATPVHPERAQQVEGPAEEVVPPAEPDVDELAPLIADPSTPPSALLKANGGGPPAAANNDVFGSRL